jgi:predicted nuclease of restriction endonuclease-like RecB superfamily
VEAFDGNEIRVVDFSRDQKRVLKIRFDSGAALAYFAQDIKESVNKVADGLLKDLSAERQIIESARL